MEVLEIATAAVKDVTYFVQSQPLAAATAFVVGAVILLRFYCRLTLGMCNCTTDMTGKTVIITGGNSGIGKFTAIELARKGARVILACRNKEKGQNSLIEIIKSSGSSNVLLKELDLSSFASVRAFAKDIVNTEDKLHVLINNAGAVGGNKRELTQDGCESVMQSNHLGHFLLTLLLLDLLKKSAPSRIINVSSEAHRFAKLDLDDLNSANSKYDGFITYNNTKLANVLFTRELARRLEGTGVTVNSLHPGMVKTSILDEHSNLITRITKVILFLYAKSAFEGAQTTIHLAVSPHLERVSGKYFSDCKLKEESKAAMSNSSATKLWHASEILVGITSSEQT